MFPWQRAYIPGVSFKHATEHPIFNSVLIVLISLLCSMHNCISWSEHSKSSLLTEILASFPGPLLFAENSILIWSVHEIWSCPTHLYGSAKVDDLYQKNERFKFKIEIIFFQALY